MEAPPRQPRGLFSGHRGRAREETLTAYLFLLPAIAITFVFGLWPVLHALYVSLHKWVIKPKGLQCIPYWFSLAETGSASAKNTDCVGVTNYVRLLGLKDVAAVGGMIAAIVFGYMAYRQWRRLMSVPSPNTGRRAYACFVSAVAVVSLGLALPGLITSGEWTYLVTIGLLIAAWSVWNSADHSRSTARLILRTLAASALISAALLFFFVDFQRMWELGNQDFLRSLIYTFFYSIGAVPVQLGVSLVLAYLLFQGIRGQGLLRLLYFMPYIAPSVATAVVFKRIFSLRDTGLMNEFLKVLGLPPLRWLNESKGVNLVIIDLLNQVFGTHLEWPVIPDPLNVVLIGPSLALVSVIIYNWWVFVGYDTVIYLAGLGSIPHDLYEAAEVDGASRWSIFRRITMPLLSPTTFFLSIISTIGTFKAFNHIFVMKEQAARGTVDVASILIFQTFRGSAQFGEAAAMSFLLFGIILALSQIQNRVGEKMVFYE